MSERQSQPYREGDVMRPREPAIVQWLAPLPMRRFRRSHWGRNFYFSKAKRSRLEAIRAYLGTVELSELLSLASKQVAVWFVEEGRPNYSLTVTPDVAFGLFKAGLTVYFNLDERKSRRVRLLAEEIAACLGHNPNRITISIFASRKGCRTLRHVDFNENFTVQLAGRKRWRLGQTTLANAGDISSRQEWLARLNGRPEHELPYLGKATAVDMQPGSLLYCPSNWLHETSTIADSISLNICLSKYTWREFLQEILRTALQRNPDWCANVTGMWKAENDDTDSNSITEFLRLVDGLGPNLSKLVREELELRCKVTPVHRRR